MKKLYFRKGDFKKTVFSKAKILVRKETLSSVFANLFNLWFNGRQLDSVSALPYVAIVHVL